MKKIQNIMCILLLYIFIYNPVFRVLGISFLKPLLLLGFVYVIRKRKFSRVMNDIGFFLFFYIGLIGSVIIQTLVIGVNAQYIVYKHTQAFLENIFLSYVIFDYLRENNNANIKNLLITVFIAALLSCYLLLNPSKSIYIRENVITDSLVDMGYKASQHAFRSFGIAEALTSVYGVIQGFLAGFCLLLAKHKKVNYIFVLPLLISAFVNARTGVLIFICALPLYLFYVVKRGKIFRVFFVMVVVGFVVLFTIDEKKLDIFEWGFSMFKDIINLFQGKKTGNFSVLISDMLFLPENAGTLIHGEGNIAISLSGKTSDISLINQIFIGGIPYMINILLLCVLLTYYTLKKTGDYELTFLVFCTFMAMEIKGMDPSLPNGFVRMLMLLVNFISIREGGVFQNEANYIFRYSLSK